MKTRFTYLLLLSFLLPTSLLSQTPNCVYMMSDVYPGSYGAYPSQFIEYNGALYFSATGNSLGVELWKYENGVTSMVQDINPGLSGSLITQLIEFNGDLYFRANTPATGMELFKYDGTSVTLAADIFPGPGGSYVFDLKVIGSYLYFIADNGVSGMELWRFNGTTASLVADINPGSAPSNPMDYEAVGSNVFIAATHPSYGLELWKFDGTTTTVVDINPGTAGSDVGELNALGSKLVFRATNGVQGYELFTHDGTTLTCLDLNPGAADFTPWELTKAGSVIYMRGFQASTGYELWKYDGVSGSLVADINPGVPNSHPNAMYGMGSTLYFGANNGTIGNEMYKYDGTSVTLLFELNPGSASSMVAGSTEKFSHIGNTLFFVATNGIVGDEIWAYNTVTEELKFGRNIMPGIATSTPAQLYPYGSLMIFNADNGVNGPELWAFNPDAVLYDTLTVVTCDDYYAPSGTLYSGDGNYVFDDIIPSVTCPGCDSLIHIDLTISSNLISNQTITACQEYTSPAGNYYNVEGNYVFTDILPSVNCPGVDSIINIDLTLIDGLNTSVVVFSGVILCQQPGVDYQWLDCNNGHAVIPGATEQDFLPSVTGHYACLITANGCSDTTNCYFVEVINPPNAIDENEFGKYVKVFPNPAKDFVTITSDKSIIETITIYNAAGIQIAAFEIDSNEFEYPISQLNSGIYFVEITTEAGKFIRKISKI